MSYEEYDPLVKSQNRNKYREESNNRTPGNPRDLRSIYNKDEISPEMMETLENLMEKQKKNQDDHRNHNHSAEDKAKSELVSRLKFSFHPYHTTTDIISLIYPVLTVLLAYVSYYDRDRIVSDELYSRFHENLERFNKATEISGPLIMAEFIKFFSICAFDILVIMYLIKPIRSPSSEVKAS